MPRRPASDRPVRWGDGNVLAHRGKWQARWYDSIGKRRSKTFATEDDAYAFLQEISRAMRAGRYVEPSELTVEEALRQWEERRSWSAVSASTQGLNRRQNEQHVIPALGRIRLVSLSAPQIQAWIDRQYRAGVAPRTIHSRVQPVKQMLAEAVRLGLIPSSPAAYLHLPAITRERHATWTSSEAAAIVAAATADGPMWGVYYRLALTTGMRPGELRALRWSDINLKVGTLVVRRTISRDESARRIVSEMTKTRRDRAIQLDPAVTSSLKEWKRIQTIHHADGYIFLGRSGSLLSEDAISNAHRRIVAAAGVPYINPHGMRHTAATLLLRAGVHPKIVSDLLGHASITTTIDIYSHVDASLQRDAVAVLGRLLDDTLTGD